MALSFERASSARSVVNHLTDEELRREFSVLRTRERLANEVRNFFLGCVTVLSLCVLVSWCWCWCWRWRWRWRWRCRWCWCWCWCWCRCWCWCGGVFVVAPVLLSPARQLTVACTCVRQTGSVVPRSPGRHGHHSDHTPSLRCVLERQPSMEQDARRDIAGSLAQGAPRRQRYDQGCRGCQGRQCVPLCPRSVFLAADGIVSPLPNRCGTCVCSIRRRHEVGGVASKRQTCSVQGTVGIATRLAVRRLAVRRLAVRR
jgi:hypothetical protein